MSLYKGAKKIAGLIRGEDISHATETHAGVIEIANQGEVLGGASDSKAVTPTKLKQYYYGKVEINDLLNAKQDIIDDLDTIRSGAGLGATSIQSVKTINGEDITGTGDITIGGASSFSDLTGQPSDNANLKTALDSKATTSELNAHTTNGVIHVTANDKVAWSQKQNAISDLDTIRSNAQAGADIVPQVNSNTQRIEDLIVSKFPNATPIGQPTVQDGYVSGFSATTYMQFPFEDISRGLPFDIYFSFTTSSDVTTQQNVIDSYFGIAVAVSNSKGLMAISTNGINWESGSIIGSNTILPNTTYYAKISWTGSEYSTALSTDDKTYVPDMHYSNSNSPHKTAIYIGGSPNIFGPNSAHPFKGTINFRGAKVYLPTLDLTVWEGMADVAVASRANVSLSNLDEAGEAKFTKGNSAYDTIQGYGDIVTHNAIEFALKSEIPSISGLAKDSDVVHKAQNETITGVKNFNGGTGGTSYGINVPSGMSIGGTTKTGYSQYATIRLVNNAVNTGSYYIDGNGSVLFRHKTGSSTAEGSANDVMFTMNPVTGIKAGWSGTAGVGITDSDLHDVLIDTVNYSKLTTTAKDIIGAINEVKTSIPSLLGYATESFVTSQGYITSSYHDSTKQDTISDLDTIRSGASAGATAIQQVKTINGESIVGSGDIEVKGGIEMTYDEENKRLIFGGSN